MGVGKLPPRLLVRILAAVFFLALSCILQAFPAFSRLRPPSARLRNPRRSPLRSTAGRPWSCFSQIYCINLDDRPDRWGFMEKQFQELAMPVQRWPAFDGRSLDFEALEELVYGGELSTEAVQRLFLPNQQKVFGMDLTPGAIGCALSHMQIWLDIMKHHGEGKYHGNERSQFLVVEDDCEFAPDFSDELVEARLAEVPDDWQLVFLGGVDAMGLQPLLQISPGVRRVYNGSRETTAYVINVEGVREALRVCFPLCWQLDTMLTLNSRLCDPPLWVSEDMMLSYTVRPMSYILWPPLAVQNKRDFRTDVQKDEHPEFLRSNSYNVAPTIIDAPLPATSALLAFDEFDAEVLERTVPFRAVVGYFAMSNQDLPVGEIRNDKRYLAWSEPLLVSGAQGCPEPCIGSCGINGHRSGRIESTAILVTPVAQPFGWEEVPELLLDGFITLTQMPYAIIGSFLKGGGGDVLFAAAGIAFVFALTEGAALTGGVALRFGTSVEDDAAPPGALPRPC
eukprot:s291_g7.t1